MTGKGAGKRMACSSQTLRSQPLCEEHPMCVCVYVCVRMTFIPGQIHIAEGVAIYFTLNNSLQFSIAIPWMSHT